jgi:hypothetical protein
MKVLRMYQGKLKRAVMLHLDSSGGLGRYEQSDMTISTLDEIKNFPPRARIDRDNITTSAIGCGIALWWTITWEFLPVQEHNIKGTTHN